MKKPEILSPAGDYSKLVYAVLYGADAVYIGGEHFSLRTASANFPPSEMAAGIEFAHNKGAKVYVACNAVPHDDEAELFPEYIKGVAAADADAVIVTDPGLMMLTKKHAPSLEIHISTQASTVNSESCRFWHEMGAKRIVLGRELSLDEISRIRENIPDDLELEAFVHGAMCVSYSGRCLLSDFMTGRSANRGECAQPCRWKYALTEEKRPGEYFPIEETDTGTYIMNSRDMCMITHIPELIRAGINSFKIEGRVKTEYYVASVTAAYRKAVDDCFSDIMKYSENLDSYYEEVCKVSHREYYEGFYFGKPKNGQNYKESSYIRDYELIAVVEKYDTAKKLLKVSQRNKFSVGETCEIISPGRPFQTFTVGRMYNENGEFILSAPHAEMPVYIEYEDYVPPYSFIRRKKID
jgi:putative protease